MKKTEFDIELIKLLQPYGKSEQIKTVEFYNEIFAEKLEQGESEEEIIKGFGSPKEIVKALKKESIFDNGLKKVKEKTNAWFTNKTFLTVYLSLFFITIPLTIAFFSVALGLLATAFALIVSYFAVTISFLVAGLAFAMLGVYLLLFVNFNTGLAQIGAWLAIFAMGVALLFCTKYLNKLRVLIFVSKSKRPEAMQKANRYPVRHRIGLVSSATIFIMAGLIFLWGFAGVGFNIFKLDTNTYVKVSNDAIVGEIKSLTVDVDNRNVRIFAATDNFRVEGYTYESNRLVITYNEDTGNLKVVGRFNWNLFRNLNTFNELDYRKTRLTIYVPADLDFINLSSSSGDFSVNNINATEATINSTSGNITTTNNTFNKLTINSTSGDVRLGLLEVNNLTIKCTSGDVRASVYGQKQNYDIIVRTTSGKKNISNQDFSNTKTINVRTTSGDVRVTFYVAKAVPL
ncbi:MAG: DUF4097 family beta strand repeat-containing protein [Firmicutes bacterium]|nr:DUF4097 family beta strand repeat-containing protein [Bacillota bacterium]